MNISVFIRGVLVTAEKNMMIYYNKPPVLIFGLLFPMFLFLAFFMGQGIDIHEFFPAFLAMVLFFTSSSVGPLITPWEKQSGTYERLLSFPVTINTIIMGDVLAGAIFGLFISSSVLIAVTLFLDTAFKSISLLLVSLLLGTFCFAALGVLIAAPASKTPSNIMMLSSLVRFPLVFISGIFIPLTELSNAGKYLALLSPLTYLVDIFHFSIGGTPSVPQYIDILALSAYTCIFLYVASYFHKKNLSKGL